MLFRSLLIQATFTYQNKLGLGFAYSLIPGLKGVAGDRTGFAEKVKTHAQYFNTHPYLASYVLGAVQKLEEECKRHDKCTEQDVLTIKNRLSGIFGSLGDRLFWKYLKPFTAIFAIIVISFFSPYYPLNITIGLVIFILIFNIFHIFYRYKGLADGYHYGIQVSKAKSVVLIEKLSLFVTGTILFLIGILITVTGSEIDVEERFLGLIIFIACGLFVFVLNLKKTLQEFTLIGGIMLSVIIYILSNIL